MKRYMTGLWGIEELPLSGGLRELPLEYKILSVDFNPSTRVAKIEFEQIRKYRTIQRYITRSYKKYPIYSEWKVTHKKIPKTIKLTNEELESLNMHEDPLIRQFAAQIVAKLQNKDLWPSWMIADTYKRAYEEKVAEINNTFEKFQKEQQKRILDNSDQTRKYEGRICKEKLVLEKYKKQEDLLSKRLSKFEKNKSIFLIIITFGIYCYYLSEKRKQKLTKKLTACRVKVSNIRSKITAYEDKNEKYYSEILSINELIENKEKEKNALIKEEKEKFKQEVDKVRPLPVTYYESDAFFTSLKAFAGFKYEKIIGCYIIRNRENGKCYVGQSKDVLRRLQQHFKGTEPTNIIFAEDYYTSSYSNKEDLFEVRIVRCKTKDELDETEKSLIEEYDAWTSGYNRTSGNS